MLYIASSISNQPLNEQLAAKLRDGGFEVGVPHELCPTTVAHDQYSLDVFEACTQAMERSAAVLVNLDSAATDSSWECGWFHARKLPVIGVAQGTTRWVKDFMLKGCLTAVVTTNKIIADFIEGDPMVSHIPVAFISSLDDLAPTVRQLLSAESNQPRAVPV